MFAITLFGAFTATASAASPIPQPPLDLGGTSFLDGEAGPGGLLEIINNGYTAAGVKDAAGHSLPGRNGQTNESLTLHPAYVSTIPLLGGHLGIELLIPFVGIHLDAIGPTGRTQGGVGDLTVAPFVQWSGLRLFDRSFSMRFGLQGVAPTGDYDAAQALNVGSNVWQLSPYYAFTWRVVKSWELSGRLIYDWSSHNLAPPAALQALSAQPGDQFAANLSASYALDEHWRIGAASYALQQLSDTRLNDKFIAGSRQRTFAAGPAASWANGHIMLIANIYREFASENRPQGFSAFLRLLCPL